MKGAVLFRPLPGQYRSMLPETHRHRHTTRNDTAHKCYATMMYIILFPPKKIDLSCLLRQIKGFRECKRGYLLTVVIGYIAMDKRIQFIHKAETVEKVQSQASLISSKLHLPALFACTLTRSKNKHTHTLSSVMVQRKYPRKGLSNICKNMKYVFCFISAANRDCGLKAQVDEKRI